MKIIVVLLAGLGSFAFAAFFLVYGIKAGIIDKHILANHFGKYDTGRQAVVRGVFYVVLGLLFLGGAILMFVIIIENQWSPQR